MKKKIKLYIFHPYSLIGGADLSLSRLINGLDKEKFEIDFISLSAPKIKKYGNCSNIKFVRINVKRTLFSVLKIRKYLFKDSQKKYKKFVFISNQNFANVLSFFILFKINWIKQILIERNHIDEFKIETNFSRKIKNFFILLCIKIFYKYADVVIGISKKLSTDLSNFSSSKVKTIYNPAFDKKIFKFGGVKILEKFKKKKFILNVSRLTKQKDHITLLKAFKIISEKISIDLIIVGYGSEIKQINNFIKKNNLKKKVHVLTNVSNPFPFYKIAKVFVLTSKYEGFGNVLVEAGMFKIPIISSNCNSGPKEILSSGKGGNLFQPGDFIKLSKLILLRLKDKNSSKINYMFKNLKKFSKKKIITEYEKILIKI